MRLIRKLRIIFKDKWPLYARICNARKDEFLRFQLFKLLKRYYPNYTPEKSVNELRKRMLEKI